MKLFLSKVKQVNDTKATVLLDNTTVYGAKYAYEAWPPKINDWFDGFNALNLRSLMDILEAIVLYDRLIIDASSRMVLVDYGGKGYESVWNVLDELDFFDNIAFAGIGGKGTFIVPLVKTAFEKLLLNLHDGTFTDGLRKFRQEDMDFVVPEFYRTPEEFSDLFSQSFSKKYVVAVQNYLDMVKHSLKNSSPEDAAYAMFAFRGFYYQEIAHLFSISYSPHTWRSRIINADTEKPSINFARFVTEVVGQVRQELEEQLNGEFSTNTFSSEFPVISSYIAHQCTRRSQLISVAIQIRNTASAQAFRKWVNNIQSSIKNQADLPKIVQARSELEVIIRDIRKELGLLNDRKTEQVKIKLGVPIASVEMPASIPIGLPDWVEQILHRKTHLIFLRDITSTSVSLSPFAYRYQKLGQ